MLITFDLNNLTTDSTKLFVTLLSTGIPPIDLKKKEVKGLNSSFFPINFILKPKYDLINIAIIKSNDFEWGTTAIIYLLSLGRKPLSFQPKIFVKINKKHKSKFKIDYRVSGEAFLTKPNKTTYMIQNIIKKITKIKPKLSTTGGTSDLRFIKAISPGLEFGLVGKTMHKVDEAVSLKDLKNLTKIYQNILQNYFKWKLV